MIAHAVATWDNTETCSLEAANTPKKYLNFDIDPLALVIAMLENGKDLTIIVEELISLGSSKLAEVDIKSVTEQHIAQADTVYKYFSNKHTMRRLKNQYISPWMLKVEDLCNSRQRINKEFVTVLVTLPRFYEENCALDPLIRKHNSFPDPRKYHPVAAFNEPIEFVKKIERRANNGKYNDYYWRTKNNQLVRIRLETKNLGSAAWEQIAKNQTIHINSEYNKVTRIQGYDFYVIEPTASMEIIDTQ